MTEEAEQILLPMNQEQLKEKAAKSLDAIVKTQGQRQKKKRKKKCGILFCIMLFSLAFLGTMGAWFMNGRIPSTLYVHRGTNGEMNFSVPATGEIVAVQGSGKSNIPEGAVTIDLNENVTMVTGDYTDYAMEVKLFGFIPFKQVNIHVVDETEITPVGIPVGFYLKTPGLLVIGSGNFENDSGQQVSPTEGKLHTGDYIISVNGKGIDKKEELVKLVAESSGKEMRFSLKDEKGSYRTERVVPQKDKNGEYKIGLWVKDSAQGIGTVTYVDDKGNFGALGHGISDVDTKSLIQCTDGTVYKTEIVRIKKGQKGEPGELTGTIQYNAQNYLGEVEDNEKTGIYGQNMSDALFADVGKRMKPLQVAFKQEIKKGPAQILSALDGELKAYDIQITAVYLNNDNINRGIVLEVTDPKLLEKTGGIVQGMSGSPILQNGKIIGAVTHVFVDNPTRGYGIFIESMLNR